MSAAPLKFTGGSSAASAVPSAKQKPPQPSQATLNAPPATKPEDISSPHELTAFVETLLAQLETKFDDMSNQLLERMGQMSSRVDSLEASIQDLINADIAPSVSPNPGTVTPRA